jgi:hypothetical protein
MDMAQLPFEIFSLLSAPGIRGQLRQAVELLAEVMPSRDHALGRAYKVCDVWQRRFELALRSEIPDWAGLAAFRCTLDYSLSESVLADLKQHAPAPLPTADCARELTTLADCWLAYHQYLVERRDLYSGKFIVSGQAAEWLQAHLDRCPSVIGGQAGNILWLWRCIGAEAKAYTAYFSRTLANATAKQPALVNGQLLWLKDGTGGFTRFADAPGWAGVSGSQAGDAPTAISLTVAENDRRLNFLLPGFRALLTETRLPEQVQFFQRGEPLHSQPLIRPAGVSTWPAIPFFGECRLDTGQELSITLADEAQLAAAITSEVDFAVIGGIDAIFYDPWLQTVPALQARLLHVLKKQLKTLAACGVRIGIELSGIPRREYAHFIRDLCSEGVSVALGINGVDELPGITGQASLDLQLFDWWFDPNLIPAEMQDGAADHFEYLTYLRARTLAEATGVRTLYVHTLTLDFILRRDADPGALLRAQLGDMMGKGLVIAALLQRNYGDRWLATLKDMPAALNPTAMARLGQFVADFERYESVPGSSGQRLLTSGCWLTPSPRGYSVAVVPVVWPHVSEERTGAGLPTNMNPTGAGDMAFGAFFLLGGV